MMQIFKQLIFFAFGFTPIGLFSQEINNETVEWVKYNAHSPDKYIIEKFMKYDVILLGEHHVVKENLLFHLLTEPLNT